MMAYDTFEFGLPNNNAPEQPMRTGDGKPGGANVNHVTDDGAKLTIDESKEAFYPLKTVSPGCGPEPETVTNASSASNCTGSDDPSTEELLAMALAELDRERSKRADAESLIATLRSDERRLRSDLIILRSQRDGFVSMVNALTDDSDAVRYALARPEDESLPLHDIRLLEIMPWDDCVKKVSEVEEEIFEWQIYDANAKQWTNKRQAFPDDFRSMPVYKPTAKRRGSATEGMHEAPTHGFWGAGARADFKGLVLTDSKVSAILNLEDGYPLPSIGTWAWVGRWRVELQHPCGEPCDENGWTYAKQPKQLLASNNQPTATSAVYGTATSCPSGGILPFRRRRWTRLRVLTGYPSISERTESCLHLRAENAMLHMLNLKLKDRVAEMGQALQQWSDRNCKTEKRLRYAETKLQIMKQERRDARISIVDVTGKCMSPTRISHHDAMVEPPSGCAASKDDPVPTSGVEETKVPSRQSSCSTEPSSSEDENDGTSAERSEVGISMHVMNAKEIASNSCFQLVKEKRESQQDQRLQQQIKTNDRRPSNELRDAIDGALRSSIDGGSAILGKIVSNIHLRSRVPEELRGSLEKMQADDNGAGKSRDTTRRSNIADNEPFRLPSRSMQPPKQQKLNEPTVSY